MDDLIEWLSGIFDEDERAAVGSGIVAWLTYRNADGGMGYTTIAASNVESEGHWVVDGREATGWATAKVIYDERRVLADIEAKRALLGAFEVQYRDLDRLSDAALHMSWHIMLQVVRTIASAYAERPGYRAEWLK